MSVYLPQISRHPVLKRILQPSTTDHNLVAIYRDNSVYGYWIMKLLKIIYLVLSASYTPGGGLIDWRAFQVTKFEP